MYHPVRETVVAVGGVPVSDLDVEVGYGLEFWEWDGQRWQTAFVDDDRETIPIYRIGGGLVYDPRLREFVVHGGTYIHLDREPLEHSATESCRDPDTIGVSLYDTWRFSTSSEQWIVDDEYCQVPQGERVGDEVLSDLQFTYDPARENAILTRVRSSIRSEEPSWDTWIWDNGSWSPGELHPETADNFWPMVTLYHDQLSTVLAFGRLRDQEKSDFTIFYWTGEQWELLEDSRNNRGLERFWDWIQRDRRENTEEIGNSVTAAYDDLRNEVILFGQREDDETATWRLTIEATNDDNASHDGCVACSC